jgi:hypothetical protein
MATFNRNDLEFILQQILMAEEGVLPLSPHLAFGLREVAGTNNNSVPGQGTYGSADQIFPRLTVPLFRTVSVNIDGTVFDPNPFSAGDFMTTSYASTIPGPASAFGVNVVDAAPRIISNLIADQSSSNLAAVEAQNAALDALGSGYKFNPGTPASVGADGSLFIPNVTPDAGFSAPYNSWFTFFGQFFDHGLDW